MVCIGEMFAAIERMPSKPSPTKNCATLFGKVAVSHRKNLIGPSSDELMSHFYSQSDRKVYNLLEFQYCSLTNMYVV